MTQELNLGVGGGSQALLVSPWLWVITANPQQKVWVKWRLPQVMKEQTVDCLNINNCAYLLYNVLYCSWAHQHAPPPLHIHTPWTYCWSVNSETACDVWCDVIWWGKILFHNNDSTMRPLLQRETKIIRDWVFCHIILSADQQLSKNDELFEAPLSYTCWWYFSHAIQHDAIIYSNVTSEVCCGVS